MINPNHLHAARSATLWYKHTQRNTRFVDRYNGAAPFYGGTFMQVTDICNARHGDSNTNHEPPPYDYRISWRKKSISNWFYCRNKTNHHVWKELRVICSVEWNFPWRETALFCFIKETNRLYRISHHIGNLQHESPHNKYNICKNYCPFSTESIT